MLDSISGNVWTAFWDRHTPTWKLNGSTDSTGEICEAYRERDSRIIVVHQQNQGALAARNAGIEQAQGKYIGFVDGDDWISEQMYQELYGLLKRYDAEVAVI